MLRVGSTSSRGDSRAAARTFAASVRRARARRVGVAKQRERASLPRRLAREARGDGARGRRVSTPRDARDGRNFARGSFASRGARGAPRERSRARGGNHAFGRRAKFRIRAGSSFARRARARERRFCDARANARRARSVHCKSAEQRSDWLIEAAQASARAGDVQAALDHAQKAALLAPHRGAAQLFARGLEYRLRRAGTPDQARETLAALDLVNDTLGVDDDALAIFLRAEALDVAQGGEAGLRFLERCVEENRSGASHALVHAAIAERLGEQWKFAESSPALERGADRKSSQVSFDDASCARGVRGCGPRGANRRSVRDFGSRGERAFVARRGAEKARASRGGFGRHAARTSRARRSSQQVPRRAIALPFSRSSVDSSSHTAARSIARPEIFREAIASAPEDTMLRAQLEAELGALAMRGETDSLQKEPSEPKVALDQPTPPRSARERGGRGAARSRANANARAPRTRASREGRRRARRVASSRVSRRRRRASRRRARDAPRTRRIAHDRSSSRASPSSRSRAGRRASSSSAFATRLFEDRNTEQARAIDWARAARVRSRRGSASAAAAFRAGRASRDAAAPRAAGVRRDWRSAAALVVWEGASSVLARDPASATGAYGRRAHHARTASTARALVRARFAFARNTQRASLRASPHDELESAEP